MRGTRATTSVPLLLLALGLGSPAAAGPVVGRIPDHDYTVNCVWHWQGIVGSSVGLLTVGAYGVSSGHPVAVEAGVDCTVYDSSGGSVLSLSSVMPGPVVATSNSSLVPLTRFSMCVSGHAVWVDGHRLTESRRCD